MQRHLATSPWSLRTSHAHGARRPSGRAPRVRQEGPARPPRRSCRTRGHRAGPPDSCPRGAGEPSATGLRVLSTRGRGTGRGGGPEPRGCPGGPAVSVLWQTPAAARPSASKLHTRRRRGKATRARGREPRTSLKCFLGLRGSAGPGSRRGAACLRRGARRGGSAAPRGHPPPACAPARTSASCPCGGDDRFGASLDPGSAPGRRLSVPAASDRRSAKAGLGLHGPPAVGGQVTAVSLPNQPALINTNFRSEGAHGNRPQSRWPPLPSGPLEANGAPDSEPGRGTCSRGSPSHAGPALATAPGPKRLPAPSRSRRAHVPTAQPGARRDGHWPLSSQENGFRKPALAETDDTDIH